MIIVYWSPVHGQTGTTSNILATSLVGGMEYRKKILLTQTHFNYNNLEAPLVRINSSSKRESKEYFRDVGLDALIRCFKSAKLDKETLLNCCLSFNNTNLFLLPGTTKSIRESFDYEMETNMLNLLRSIEEVHEVVCVDISSGDNPLSKKLMEAANLVVVNLSQNMEIIDLFFQQYRDKIETDKIYYLFGNYDCNSKYNISNIRRKYYKNIKVNNSGVIPYNTSYRDAQVDSKVIDFVRNNLKCQRKDDNYYFMQKAKSATGKIFKMAGVSIERM